MSQRLLNLINESDRLVCSLMQRRERAIKELVKIDARLDEAKKTAIRYRRRLTKRESISTDAADMIKDWNGIKTITRKTPAVDTTSALPDDTLLNLYPTTADNISWRAS
jgi:Ribonuclease G/E